MNISMWILIFISIQFMTLTEQASDDDSNDADANYVIGSEGVAINLIKILN